MEACHWPRGENKVVSHNVAVIASGQQALIALRHGINQEIEALGGRSAAPAHDENRVMVPEPLVAKLGRARPFPGREMKCSVAAALDLQTHRCLVGALGRL